MHRVRFVCSFLLVTAGCSLATSWDKLPIGVGPDADAAGDVTTPPLDSGPDVIQTDGGCIVGRYYCGGDILVGDPSTLYQCVDNGGFNPAVTCSKGCVRREPLSNDACICVVGSFYCGNDQVVGDPKKLYKCAPDYSGTLVQTCPNQCVVNTGNDDTCK